MKESLKMLAKKIPFLFCLFLFSTTFNAQNEFSPVAIKILKELKIPESKIAFEFYSEKVMPGSPEKSIYVLPKYSGDITEDSFELDANIIVADNKTGVILAKYQEAKAYSYDAVRLESFNIDTGLFFLNKETRAFGIRVNYSGSSRPNPYSRTDLSLFVEKKGRLHKVLDNYEINSYIGEWDTNCAGEFEGSDGKISFETAKTSHYNNMKVKFNVTKTINHLTDDDCISKDFNSTKTAILKFNGKEYK